MITFAAVGIVALTVTGLLSAVRNAKEMRRGARLAEGFDPAVTRLPIVMPVCGRAHYLRRVLEALREVEGIEETLLVISQDGRNPEVSKLVEQVDFAPVIRLRHTRPFLGLVAYFWDSLHAIGWHLRFLLTFSFQRLGAEHTIVLEDDILPSPDLLRYFVWASEHVLQDERVLSVTGFNVHSRLEPDSDFDPREHPHTLVEIGEKGRPGFTCWGWATSRRGWRRSRRRWSNWSWDHGLARTQRRLGLISYKPVLARVKNIGMSGGVNFTEPEGNPKWTEIVMAEAPYEGAPPPVLLADDPARPEYQELVSPEPSRREVERNRGRRRWLLAGVLVLTAVELALWLALRSG